MMLLIRENMMLLIRDEKDNTHYVLVKTLSRLFSSSTLKRSKLLCPHCLLKFYPTQDKLDEHISICSNAVSAEVSRLDIDYKCPTAEKNTMKFIHNNRKYVHPFHVMADFESTLVKQEVDENLSTQKYQKHLQNSFGLKFCSIHKEHDGDIEILNSTDPNEVSKQFVLKVEEYTLKAYKLMMKNKHNIIDKVEKKQLHDSITHCQECNIKFDKDNKKVMHHDHVTGKYISTLCYKCNLDFKCKLFYLFIYIT
jgi:hypothetical protein